MAKGLIIYSLSTSTPTSRVLCPGSRSPGPKAGLCEGIRANGCATSPSEKSLPRLRQRPLRIRTDLCTGSLQRAPRGGHLEAEPWPGSQRLLLFRAPCRIHSHPAREVFDRDAFDSFNALLVITISGRALLTESLDALDPVVQVRADDLLV